MADPLLSCSFCLRTSAEVDRLLQGASAYICDGCVATCDRILSDPSTPFPGMEADDDDAVLARLRSALDLVASADSGVRGLVGLLRTRGVSWAQIGEAIGVSRQSAWERFADH